MNNFEYIDLHSDSYILNQDYNNCDDCNNCDSDSDCKSDSDHESNCYKKK